MCPLDTHPSEVEPASSGVFIWLLPMGVADGPVTSSPTGESPPLPRADRPLTVMAGGGSGLREEASSGVLGQTRLCRVDNPSPHGLEHSRVYIRPMPRVHHGSAGDRTPRFLTRELAGRKSQCLERG